MGRALNTFRGGVTWSGVLTLTQIFFVCGVEERRRSINRGDQWTIKIEGSAGLDLLLLVVNVFRDYYFRNLILVLLTYSS